jgi:3'(2'), 5'-bisphosphate nucleotidase
VNQTRSQLLDQAIVMAAAAAEIILEIYATDFKLRGKSDASPVPEADDKAEALILEGLVQLTSTIRVISEEAAAARRKTDVAKHSGWSIRSTIQRKSSAAMAGSQ